MINTRSILRFERSRDIFNLFLKNDKVIFDPIIKNIQNKDVNFGKLKK